VSLDADSKSVIEAGLKDPQEGVQLAAVEFVARTDAEGAVSRLEALTLYGSIKAQQTAYQLLGELKSPAVEKILLASFDRSKSKQLSASVVLDLVMAAEAQGTAELKNRIAAFRTMQQEAGNVLSLWSECTDGGNAERGRSIFFGRSAASCRRCHKVAGSGGEVGPDLSKIGKEKDRNYLLEAIVDPNAKVAKGFETVILVTVDGLVHSGILKTEDDQVVQLMTPTGALVSVAKDEIDERANGQSGMPQDLVKSLTRSEIRDLVEYLTTLQSEPDGAHGEKGK
jgi:quinoprotein glucose dehydrogenase